MFGSVFGHSVPARKTIQNGCISSPECIIDAFPISGGFFRNERMQSSYLDPRTCLGVFLGIRFRHEKRCKTGAFRHPNALLPGSETRVDFFATNACNLPKYALEHVWERSEEHTSELQSLAYLVCRLLLEKKK